MNSNYTFRHSNLEMDSSGILPCTTYGSMEYSTESMNPTTILTNLPTNIHINPRLCASRSVYINKALYASQSGNTVQKCERIHYNPRFFKAPTTIPSANTIIPIPNTKEVKIHINPKFINKESHPKLNQPKCNKITDHSIEQVSSENRSTDNLSTISGIYVNPKFFNDLTNERIPEAPSSVSSNSKPNSDSKLNTPGEKYVTKYKIVKKKNSPATNNLKKNNLKKLNQILLRKSRYKLIKGKYLIYTSQKCNKNPNLEKNTLKVKTNMFANTSNKILPTSHNIKLVRTIFNKYNLPLINKKSILQQKIEARRKVKSSLNQTTSNSVPFRSKYKYVRSPANSQKTNIIKNHSQNPNLNKNNIDVTRSSSTYYSIGKTQLVRQSVLQKKIELRRHIRKVSSNINLQKVSKYRLVRSNSTTPKKLPCNNRTALLRSIRKKRSLLKFSSEKYRSEKIKKIALLTKKLKKNNVPCPFYSRFGHCKGKDRGSCLKLHDSKYITICKRFVKGECKDEKCTLSHEIRPEKMPTCHHYLAGLCKRTDCPFLHIKVNQKAPICRAFLQGFCADVFKCTKRHEYICPIFAEKGTCHRGKSCKLPHRTTTICSKLLKPDEFPLLNRKHIAKNKKFEKTKVSTTNENIIVDSSEDKGGSLISERYKEDKPKEFKRYFLASLSTDVSNENSCDSSDEPSL